MQVSLFRKTQTKCNKILFNFPIQITLHLLTYLFICVIIQPLISQLKVWSVTFKIALSKIKVF